LTAFHIRDIFPDMESTIPDDNLIDRRIAQRLRGLRAERNWSLDELATRSSVSRATLSRLENAAVSPTASVLGKLCVAYGLPMSRLMRMVEEDFAPHVPRAVQPVWSDASVGFRRRSVSPPAQALAGEVLECELDAGALIAYDASPRPGLEHHLFLLEGRLQITVDGQRHDLEAGDCLRYLLFGPSAFVTPADSAARYLLFIV
jgi:transcriptional regulator with XRE-family HTH domain